MIVERASQRDRVAPSDIVPLFCWDSSEIEHNAAQLETGLSLSLSPFLGAGRELCVEQISEAPLGDK